MLQSKRFVRKWTAVTRWGTTARFWAVCFQHWFLNACTHYFTLSHFVTSQSSPLLFYFNFSTVIVSNSLNQNLFKMKLFLPSISVIDLWLLCSSYTLNKYFQIFGEIFLYKNVSVRLLSFQITVHPRKTHKQLIWSLFIGSFSLSIAESTRLKVYSDYFLFLLYFMH